MNEENEKPRPQRKGLRKGVYIIPSLFTTANIFCGFSAVILSVNGSVALSLGNVDEARADFDMAAIFIGWAVLFDFLDGFRNLQAGAALGALDLLAGQLIAERQRLAASALQFDRHKSSLASLAHETLEPFAWSAIFLFGRAWGYQYHQSWIPKNAAIAPSSSTATTTITNVPAPIHIATPSAMTSKIRTPAMTKFCKNLESRYRPYSEGSSPYISV